jgi:hypothetical protein
VLGPDGETCVAGLQQAAITDWGVPLGRPRPSTRTENETNDVRREP